MIADSANFQKVTSAHFKTAMKWFEHISGSDKWNLIEADKRKLLGNISPTKYESLLLGNTDDFSAIEKNDVIERLSILITIFRYLYALVGNDHAYSLFSKPNSNPIFSGKSVKEILLASDSLEQFYMVRKYLIDTSYY
jgi:hypothetical protein